MGHKSGGQSIRAAVGIAGQFDGMEIDGKCKKDGGGNRTTGKDLSGAPGVIRTRDPLLRRQTLYPTELRAQPH
jgi:hypothetical protein